MSSATLFVILGITNNGNATVDALNVGDSLNEVFSYEMTDGTSFSSSTLTIKIKGFNDPPVANPNTRNIDEDEMPNTRSGNVLNNDTVIIQYIT